jgi:DNA-binding MarR family transcriptional regulator
MNKNETASQDSHKTFLLLSEIEKEERLSQRELANRLGIALGLVNSYMKNFVTKGFVRVKAFPRNRYGYLLTPRGFTEKSRLAYQHLNYFTSLYTATRQDYLELFRSLQVKGIAEVVFCGVDEVAEIAYLSLQETDLRLTVVMDGDGFCGGDLFGMKVVSLADGVSGISGAVVLTSLKRGADLREKLREYGWQQDIYAPPALSNGDM